MSSKDSKGEVAVDKVTENNGKVSADGVSEIKGTKRPAEVRSLLASQHSCMASIKPIVYSSFSVLLILICAVFIIFIIVTECISIYVEFLFTWHVFKGPCVPAFGRGFMVSSIHLPQYHFLCFS